MASRFWVLGTGTWDASTTTNWSATSGGAGGQSVPVDGDTVTFDALSGAGTCTVGTGYNPTVTSISMGAYIGTLDFSAFNNSPTMDTFNCSGTGVRTLNMGSGTWTLRGSGGNVFDISTTTNLTFSGASSTIKFTYSGSVGTRTLSFGGAPTLGTLWVSAGSDTINCSTCTFAGNLDFTGFNGLQQLGGSNYTVRGNLIMGVGMTTSTSGAGVTFTNTATSTITSNGVQLTYPITINATAGITVQLADALNLSSSRTLTLTQGTFNTNNFNVTCGLFSSSNSNTRTLTMGSGTWTVTGTGTVWTVGTSTNLTLNAGTSTILINDASASSKTFVNGGPEGSTYNNLRLSGAGTGAFILGASIGTAITFTTIFIDTPPHTIQIFAGKTIICGSLALTGVSGSLNTFESTTATTPFTFSVASGTVSQDYISLKDSTATGGATFYAGANSTNVSGNTGWTFTASPRTGVVIGRSGITNSIGIM